MTSRVQQLEIAECVTWNVHTSTATFGIGRKLGTVQAATRAEAVALARKLHGKDVEVLRA